MTSVEFLYDFSSPNCYVAYHRLLSISSRRGVEVRMVPLFLGGLFKATNDGPVPKGSLEYNYMAKNLERLSREIGVEFNFPASLFPVNSVRALRGSYLAEAEGKARDYVTRVFRAYWVEGVDISDASKLGQIAESVGVDRAHFLGFIEKEETKLRLREETDRAYRRGVFGAPTYFIDGEMYWGTPEVLWYLESRFAPR